MPADRRLSKLSMEAPEQQIVPNMVKMRFLDELSILRNLELRFNTDEIYTYVGTVLISVNPFRQLKLYTPDVLEMYSEPNLSNPPHVFAVADRAYRSLLQTWTDQSVIVSGESGAGKTEATKVFLEYLMEMSRRAGGADDETSEATESLEELCLYAQTILEAFGNAKTVRNDNSSRFGKWIEVHFSRAGQIQGANINTYLLEKSRVVTTEEGERNYHVFYELLAYAAQDPELKSKYSLGNPKAFNYLSQSSVTQIQGVSDVQEFIKLREALAVFGVSKEDTDSLWRVLAAILHLGNIQFKLKRVQNQSTSADGSEISNPDVSQKVADLLKIPYTILEKALLFHSYGTRSLVYIPYKPEEAAVARDALAKALYAGLFNYVGERINLSLCRGRDFSANKTIGVLDIFGFEILKTNGFEQLCINFCNERLQSHFNEECFRIEQEEYKAEGVQVEEIPYYDNQPCVDLLEQRPQGIFAMIDEEINTPGGDDKNLVMKMFQQHGSSEHLAKVNPKEGANCFKINHYAGAVLYKGDGLLDKSKDSLHEDLDGALNQSDDPFVPVVNASRSLGTAAKSEAAQKGHVRMSSVGKGKSRMQPTLGTQFCRQLDSLMKKLHTTTPHFIKCLKPNMEKRGQLFVADEMLAQLRYTGIVGLCKIRQIGYPERMPLDEFALAYNPLCFGQPTPEDLILALAEEGVLKDGLWVLGTTKLLMKHEQHNYLAEALTSVQQQAAVRIQKHMKGWWTRILFKKMEVIRLQLREAIERRQEEGLVTALAAMDDLPNRGNHLQEKSIGVQLLNRLREEKQAEAMLKEAIEARDLKQLEASITLCKNMKYTSKRVSEASSLMAQLQLEQAVYEALIAAIQTKDRAQLAAALSKADKGKMDFAEVRQARGLIARLDHEALLLKRYETALAAGDVRQVDEVLKGMTEAGFPIPKDAKENLANLEQKLARETLEARLATALESSVKSNDVDQVEAALQRAIEQGYEGESVTAAKEFLSMQHKKKDDLGALMAACKTLEVKMESVAGIESSELEGIHRCLDRMTGHRFSSEEETIIKEAQNTLHKGLAVQQCTVGMEQGLRTRDYNLLTASLEKANKYQLKMDILSEVKEMIAQLEMEGPQIPAGSMEQILEIARNSRWKFSKYRGLRTREAYAKGKYLNRKRCIETMFMFNKEVVPNSLMDLPSALSKVAVNTNKCLLAFCGTRRTTYPATYAHSLLEKGKKDADLRDEIFVQMCKYLTNNPDKKASLRGWMLLCMCIDMFSPSVQFELHLLNFVADHIESEYSEYATYCLERLEEELDMDEETLIEMVENKQLPSIDFITTVINGDASPFLSRSSYY